MCEVLESVLLELYGFNTFRAGQREVIDAHLDGHDCVVVMPTGGGKSLCYQLPAVLRHRRGEGGTLVVSPLIALMDDQVSALNGRGIRAAAIHSGQSADDNDLALDAFECGELALLYLSPERLASPGFRQAVARCEVATIAVDEAHCISQWGHDFRPEYAQIGEVSQALALPVLALTATATPRVVDEIGTTLGMNKPRVFRQSFARPNLNFRVERCGDENHRLERVAECLRDAGFAEGSAGRAIVYAGTRKRVDEIAKALDGFGFHAGAYHAGKSEKERQRVQTAYLRGRIPVLVATNAFGMGIDQPDVRLVVHAQAPGSLEAYYQEAGRAGRDGEPADVVLLYADRDRQLQNRLQSSGRRTARRKRAQAEALEALSGYVEKDSGCRQVALSEYFGEFGTSPCTRCDLCTDRQVVHAVARPPSPPASPVLETRVHEWVIEAVESLRRPVGKASLAKALRGSKAKALKKYGLHSVARHGELREYDEASLVATIDWLVGEGILENRGDKYPTVWRAGKPVRSKRTTPVNRPRAISRRGRTASRSPLRQELVNYRRRQARALNWKLYMVFNNAVIDSLQRQLPRTIDDLQSVPGLGPSKVERFGIDLLAIVREHHG